MKHNEEAKITWDLKVVYINKKIRSQVKTRLLIVLCYKDKLTLPQ